MNERTHWDRQAFHSYGSPSLETLQKAGPFCTAAPEPQLATAQVPSLQYLTIRLQSALTLAGTVRELAGINNDLLHALTLGTNNCAGENVAKQEPLPTALAPQLILLDSLLNSIMNELLIQRDNLLGRKELK